MRRKETEMGTNGKGTNHGLIPQDLGNIVALEHVNLTVPDRGLATLFYIEGLGGTRDPYMLVGLQNMWLNFGKQQFHLPNRAAQVIPGHIGLVVPDLDDLVERLKGVTKGLAGTQFSCSRAEGYVAVTCPWGNQFRCYAPNPSFGDMLMGIPYVEFMVAPGAAAAIGEFYEKVLGAPYTLSGRGRSKAARVSIGRAQWLEFQETSKPVPPYDGHHVAVYLANFSRPYEELQRRGLVTEDVGKGIAYSTSGYQYRFKDFVDLTTKKKVFSLEHEVRSTFHPMFERTLVNRNPAQGIMNYVRGADALPQPVG